MTGVQSPKLSSFGQLPQFGEGFTADLAKKVVSQADPAVRDVLKEQRTQFAQALLSGLPYATAAGVAAVVTSQIVPPIGLAKGLGYAASIGLGALGTYKILSTLSVPPKPPPPPEKPTIFTPLIDQASKILLTEAEPKVRKIVDDERARLSKAAQAGLPWIAGGGAIFVATAFLLPAVKNILKTVGYTAAIGLVTAGLWIGFEKIKGA